MKNTDEHAIIQPERSASGASILTQTIAKYSSLLPCILGLTFGRSGLIISSYGSYTSTDAGIFTEGSTLLSLLVLAGFLIYLQISNKIIAKRTVNLLMRICIAIEAGSLAVLAILEILSVRVDGVRFVITTIATLAAAGAIFYWMRRIRGSSSASTAIFAFGSLFLSEIVIYISGIFPPAVGYVFAGILSLLQYPCILWARNQIRAYEILSIDQADSTFSFAKTMFSKTRYIVATAIGIACFSFVIGLLRGYPTGVPIGFTPETRLSYSLLTMALCVVLIVLVLRGKRKILSVGIWILMQVLAVLALIAYAAFPENPEVGAVFTTTLNAMMVGFIRYFTVASMNVGKRDPYYYAISGWVVWHGGRAFARIALLYFFPVYNNDMLINAVISGLLMLSTQIIFVQFLNIKKNEEVEEKELGSDAVEPPHSMMERFMGLNDTQNFSDMRKSTMQTEVERLGTQFLLSSREIEVLTFYMLGFTQRRVAEELFISQSTVHAHLKRIYRKTGMHSRQIILDYIAKYIS